VILAGGTALLATVFASLGQWQLHRAQEQDRLKSQFLAGRQIEELRVLPDLIEPAHTRYRRIEVSGHYVSDVQVLLDNMTQDGVVGYQVLTPFVLDDKRTVVVNRGWVPAGPDRAVLPDVPVDARNRIVSGLIDSLPVPALRLGANQAQAGPLRVLSFPKHGDLEREFSRSLVPYQLLLDQAQSDGYRRAWGPPESRADRNLAYAGQWFLLAAATGLGGVAFLFKNRWQRRRPA
jgi:surfeit locus 1 family protein